MKTIFSAWNNSRMGGRFPAILLLLFWVTASGCAGVKLKDARQAFRQGDVDKAAEIIQDVDGSGLSKLEYLMEKGMIFHHAGDYEKSIRELRQAADLIREQDIISVSQQAGSLVINEWVTEYKGEYSERLWVHTYLMMNYLLSMQFEAALVEAKQAQKVLDEYPEALSREYFTRGLIALCYEMLGEYNDALIVYKKLAELLPDGSIVQPQINRLARRLGFQDELEPVDGDGNRLPDVGRLSELVVFVGMGNGPQKTSGNILLPPGIRISFPRYEKKTGVSAGPEILGRGIRETADNIETDVVAVANDALDERAKLIYTKEAARVAAKEAIVRGFEGDRDSLAGLLIRLAFIAMEEADTRGWETLPSRLALVRVFLDPGDRVIQLRLWGDSGNHTVDIPETRFAEGETVFYSVRAAGGSTFLHGMRPAMEPTEEEK